MSNRLATNVVGLKLSSPTMLAAGVLGLSGAFLNEIARTEVGAVVTKSIGLNPRSGYHNPTIVQVDCGLLNAIGLSNPGIHEFGTEIAEAKKVGVPLIVNIFGFSVDEFSEVASYAAKAGADALELNVSCPHVEKAGAEIGQDPQLVKEIVSEVKKRVRKPVFVKLTANVGDITEIAKAAVEGGADAITAINTVRAMAINIETTHPILANKIGGLSGPAIKPITVRCVYEIYQEVDVPVVGCGGIATWRDAVEFMLAGASAVQVGTAIAFKGLKVFRSINHGISLYLRKNRFRSVKNIVGLSHRC